MYPCLKMERNVVMEIEWKWEFSVDTFYIMFGFEIKIILYISYFKFLI